MPRVSIEARAAAAFRGGAARPAPPRHLSAPAKRLWEAILADRPADWFRPGSYELLEQYCEFTVQQRRAIETLRKAEGEDYGPALAATKSLTTMLTALASKLRLSVQADVDRRAVGKAAERGDGTRDPLLGGAAVWGEHVQ
jgi:phage terminase small subunit